jgi:ribosome biogenesis GTPase
MRLVRKQIRRNRKPDRVRNKGWTPEGLEDLRSLEQAETWDDHDSPVRERIMPRGERERRKANLARASQSVSEAQVAGSLTTQTGSRGTVMEVSTGLCRASVEGRELLCGLRGSLSAADTGFTNVVAVGDHVIVEAGGGTEQGIVIAVLPRRSVLLRPDVFRPLMQQVIVANADQLLIVASWREPAVWLELIDRYLITAERNRLAPIVCVNKTDLADSVNVCQAEMRPYLELGYRMLFTSAVRGDGVEELRSLLRDRTTVLVGLSGVGKSTLLQAVQPGLNLRTAETSARHHEGKHTTTQVNMLRLEMGGFVVDTPGIREFGLAGLRRRELAQYYPEIVALALDCRFADCTHGTEPDCAVRAAAERGISSRARYDNYCKIWDALPR